MISTILTSLHTFSAILQLAFGTLTLLSNPKARYARIMAALMLIFSLSNISFGLQFNSYAFDQAVPWAIVETFTTYTLGPLVLLTTWLLLRPNVARNNFAKIAAWFLILIPSALLVLDLTGLSQQIFTGNVILSLDTARQNYTGGYLPASEIATPLANTAQIFLLAFSYSAALISSIIVAIQDRKKDKFNQTNAIILAIFLAVTMAISGGLVDILAVTVSALIANIIIAFGLFYVGLEIQSKDKPKGNSWLQNILENYPMFTKLTSVLAIILVPTIAFISFSSLSIFQSSLIGSATENLVALSDSEARQISSQLEQDFQALSAVQDNVQVAGLLATRDTNYQNLSGDAIQQVITQNEARWNENDRQLVSTTLAPVKNVNLQKTQNENGRFINIALIDSYGGLITATKNPGSYRYSLTDWFLYVSELQENYVGDFYWNAESGSYIAELALPIFSPNGGLSGVIYGQYDLTEILNSLSPTNENRVGFGLANSTGTLLTRPDEEITAIEYPLNALTPPAGIQAWRAYTINDESMLFETATIYSFRSNLDAPWLMATYQPTTEAIAPLAFARTTILIIALLVAGVAAMLMIYLTQSIVTPMERLRDAAEQIQSGKPGAIAEISSQDEFGALAQTFNLMSTELGNLVSGLEKTINTRTKDLVQRASQLEASAVVAREAAEAQDLDSLLELAARLIPEKFGYYHCGIFLLDEQDKYAVLQASNSEGGNRMLDRGHRLQVGRVGVVGYCAGTGTARIAQDVGADVVYYANPDMPETRSEMALPLIVRKQRIGVLDIQSTEANAFQEEDIEILQVLADQVALAIDNTRLLESSQQSLKQLEVFYGQEASRSWKDRLAGEEIAYAYDATGLIRSGAKASLPVSQNQAPLSKPITFRGQVIGNLDFIRDAGEGEWTNEESQLIEDILEQTALALENARLVQQIRLRSDQIRLLQEITAMAASIMDEDELLHSVARKLQTSLQAQHCGVVLRAEDSEVFTLVASATKDPSDIVVGNQINILEDPITREIIDKADNLAFQNVVGDPRYQVFVQTFSTKKPAAIITLPLLIRDQAAGYIFLEESDVNKVLDQEEDDLFTQINAQISTALESARLFKAEQQGRQAAAALLEITQIASASLDINRVLNQATNRSAQAIQAHRCTIFILDEKEKIKPLVSIYASGQAMQGEEWETLQEKVRETYQDIPLRRLASSMREVAIVSNPLAHKAFPLGWTAAFDIHNLLMIPLISQNKVVGTMIYDQVDPAYSFRENQVDLAQTIAGQIATTIENANLFEEAVTRAERERQITEITAKIRSSNDPQEIMDTAISELRAALAKSTLQSRQAPHKKQTASTNGKETGQN